jgi:hypothetical protein
MFRKKHRMVDSEISPSDSKTEAINPPQISPCLVEKGLSVTICPWSQLEEDEERDDGAIVVPYSYIDEGISFLENFARIKM